MNPNVPSTSSSGVLRVAILGAGYFSQFHLDGWQRLAQAGQVELIGVVEPDQARRDAAVKQFGATAGYEQLDDLLAKTKPDLLDIATPPPTHLPLVRRAAQAQIDCIVQKPLAPTLSEAEEIVAVAKEAGIRLVVHENFRWMPWYLEMKRALESGLLGEPHTVSVRMRPGDGQGASAYLSRQPYFQKMPRFLVHETAIHFIDSFRFLFGEVVAVTARLRRMNPAIAGEDAGYIVLEFESGATGLIDGNRLNDHSADNTRLTMGEHWLEGSAGVMHLNGDGGLRFKPHGQTDREHAYLWEDQGFGGDCVFALQAQVIEDIQRNAESANTGKAYLRNIRIAEAVYESSEKGKTIRV